MRHALLTTLASLAVISTTSCSEAASEPTAVQTEALVASAAAWQPADITRDLQVDDATRRKIEGWIESLHASLLEMHERHETSASLEGDARAAYMEDLQADMQTLHEQHKALWDSLDPAVQQTLTSRLHEQMRKHDDDDTSSLHERMRRMHGGDHAPHDAGH
jgi:hypothetical protein